MYDKSPSPNMNKPIIIPKLYLTQLIDEGKTTKQISQLTNVSISTVYANVRRHGLRMPDRPKPKTVLSSDQIREAARLYHEEGYSTFRLAHEFGVGQSVMHRSLIRAGERLRPVDADYRRYRLNETYFDHIDTEEKAYFLGLLYADGGLVNHHGKRVITYSIRLGLIATDDDILIRLRDALYPDKDKQISYPDRSGGYAGSQPSAYVEIHSKRMFNALVSKGCGLRKSLTLQFPTSDQVPDHLLRHFVRGYFDGDGCITWNRKKWRVQATFSILSSRAFSQGFANVMDKHGVYAGLSQTKHSPQVWKASINKQASLLFLYDYLYQATSLYLARKKVLFDRVIQMIHERSTLRHDL